MSVLLDSSVTVATKLDRQPERDQAYAALRRAASGTWGKPVVTDYLVDEAVTVCRARAHSHQAADDLAAFLLGEPPYPRFAQVLRVDEDVFVEARRLFRAYSDRPLSFTDCTNIAVVRLRNVDAILSFDRDFDGLVPRIDPARLHA